MSKKVGGFVLIGIVVLGAALVAQKANLPPRDGKALIEVHGPKIAYVPMTETYVKYDGQVRRIAKFTATLEGGKDNCRCPKCCEGYCYVIIYTDLISPSGPIRSLYILWMACD